jgi:hypothetical protein
LGGEACHVAGLASMLILEGILGRGNDTHGTKGPCDARTKQIQITLGFQITSYGCIFFSITPIFHEILSVSL